MAIKQQNQKEKKVFGNIFAKGGLYDDVKTTDIKPEVKKVDSDSDEGEGEVEQAKEEVPVESKPEDKEVSSVPSEEKV